jgi:hypothetical protein
MHALLRPSNGNGADDPSLREGTLANDVRDCFVVAMELIIIVFRHEIHNPVLNQDYAKDFTEPQLNETANPYKTYPARLKLPWP